MTTKRPISVLPLLILFALPPSLGEACTVCFGAPGSVETTAIGWSILFLGCVIVLVLGCVAAFAVNLAVRAARHPLPEHQAIAEALETRVS
jgi:uncharacterized membrane protein